MDDPLHLLDRDRPETPARRLLEGRVVRLAREQLGLSQGELARRVGVRSTSIAKLEDGTRSIRAWTDAQLQRFMVVLRQAHWDQHLN
ncbi:MAG TPA: helix-turn-helix transcriptional regulator [Dehalococcoidia bacterium]|nr:helix-turn-helix transcriptional regulator [Dehalococcoidia bacterium]